jgi:hypothetical protein
MIAEMKRRTIASSSLSLSGTAEHPQIELAWHVEEESILTLKVA